MNEKTTNRVSFREFYDPERVLDDVAFSEYLKRRIPDSATIQGLGILANRGEILTAEGVHANLLTDLKPEDYPFDVAITAAFQTQDKVQTDVQRTVKALKSTLFEVRQQESGHIAFRSGSGDTDIVLAGKILSSAASQGARRRSGRDYYMHPHEVAQILRVATSRFSIDENELDRLLFIAYCHDAFEDIVPISSGTFLSADTPITPLVVSETLKALGDHEHESMADTIMLLSKPVGPNGKLAYSKYIQRGLADPRFIVTKLADTQHNVVIEPNIAYENGAQSRRTSKKNAQYRQARETLLLSADSLDNIVHTLMAHAITVISKKDLQQFPLLGSNLVHYDAFANLFRNNVRMLRQKDT